MSVWPVSKSVSKDALIGDLKGAKLVVPSIAVGNVPQLSTDLLIHNLGTKLIARLDSTLLYPFASPVDYVQGSKDVAGPTESSTALELYFNNETKVAIIQQRSPVLPGFAKNFIEYITSFIKEAQFASVVVLDSNDSALREDINIDRPLELFSNTLTEHFKSLKVSTSDSQDKLEESFTPFVRSLVTELENIKSLAVYALVIFVYEGDNFYDAQVISQEATHLLELSAPSQWQRPVSWMGAYGDRPLPTTLNEGIYG